jgi:hypothetical protein
MADEIHPVVELLVARMDSHPEEFRYNPTGSLAITGRWETWIAQLGWYMNEAEKALIYGKAKELIFQRIHEEVLDELLNGDERRRKAEADRLAEAKAMTAMQTHVQQAYGTLGMGNSNPYMDNMTTALTNELRLGSESLSEGLLKQIKGKLGL